MPQRPDDPRISVPRNPKVVEVYPATFEKLSGNRGAGEITTPGPRPWAFQTAQNFQISLAANAPQPLTVGQFAASLIVIDVDSALSTSAYFGYGSQVSPGSGIEVIPGIPHILGGDDGREQWELQRPLEIIASIMLNRPLSPYRASRVLYDASQWYLISRVAMNVAVMLMPPIDF